jgi:hypothetical protein
MNGLDIVLINVISYLGGILSGLYIHHKINKSKKCSKDKNNEDEGKEKENKEYDVTQVYNSPVLASAIPNTIANAPPPMNPNYMNSNSNSSLQKRITITTE